MFSKRPQAYDFVKDNSLCFFHYDVVKRPPQEANEFPGQIPLYQVEIVRSRSNHNNNLLLYVSEKLDKEQPYYEILYNMLVALSKG